MVIFHGQRVRQSGGSKSDTPSKRCRIFPKIKKNIHLLIRKRKGGRGRISEREREGKTEGER